MNEQIANITLNNYYENLKHAKNTKDRYHWLNAALDILEQFPTLSKYFERRDSSLVAGRLHRVSGYKKFDLCSVPRFDDGIDREKEKVFKKVEGLYFIGEVTFNPILHEILYWVKIGYSSNLATRIRNYDTHCPTTWRIDFSGDGELEDYYHQLLGACCLDRAAGNEEWFRVDEKTYLEMCEKGFSYFN